MIDLKSVNNPKTVDALKHLQEMFINAQKALVEGKPMVIVLSFDHGEHFVNQDVFNEVNLDISNNFINYSARMLSKMDI